MSDSLVLSTKSSRPHSVTLQVDETSDYTHRDSISNNSSSEYSTRNFPYSGHRRSCWRKQASPTENFCALFALCLRAQQCFRGLKVSSGAYQAVETTFDC